MNADALLARFLEGSLSDEERRELEEAKASSPLLGREIQKLQSLEALLRRQVQTLSPSFVDYRREALERLLGQLPDGSTATLEATRHPQAPGNEHELRSQDEDLLLAGYLEGHLAENESRQFSALMAQNPRLAEELREISALEHRLGQRRSPLEASVGSFLLQTAEGLAKEIDAAGPGTIDLDEYSKTGRAGKYWAVVVGVLALGCAAYFLLPMDGGELQGPVPNADAPEEAPPAVRDAEEQPILEIKGPLPESAIPDTSDSAGVETEQTAPQDSGQ